MCFSIKEISLIYTVIHDMLVVALPGFSWIILCVMVQGRKNHICTDDDEKSKWAHHPVVVARSTARTTRPTMTSPTPPLVAGTNLRLHHAGAVLLLRLIDEPPAAAGSGSFKLIASSSCLGLSAPSPPAAGGAGDCSDGASDASSSSSSCRRAVGKKNRLISIYTSCSM
jgi:hypothetical protein